MDPLANDMPSNWMELEDAAIKHEQDDKYPDAANLYLRLARHAHEHPRQDIRFYQAAAVNFTRAGEDRMTAVVLEEVAEILDANGAEVESRQSFDEAAKLYEDEGLVEEAAACYMRAAEVAQKEENFAASGERSAQAARVLSKNHLDEDRALLFASLCNAAMSYAKAGRARQFNDVYNRLHNILIALRDSAKSDLHFHNLIRALDESGLDDLAGRVYVDKMNARLRRFCDARRILPAVGYGAWRWTSDYGENSRRFLMLCLGTVALFGVLYAPNPWGVGCLELADHGAFAEPKTLGGTVRNILVALNYSLKVFTNLGFSGVTPVNLAAQLVGLAEQLLGYVYLGILITLIGGKVLRGAK